MLYFLLFLLFPLVFGQPLTEEENDNLQHTCGMPDPKYTGTPTIARHKRSLYGIPALPEDAPWAVGTVYASKWFPNITETQLNAHLIGWCTGSLISNRHVITAAHCIGWENTRCKGKDLFDFNPVFKLKNIQRLQVIIGSECVTERACRNAGKPFSAKQIRNVSRVFMPSYYKCSNSSLPPADVAVFELEEEVPLNSNLYPTCLSDYDSKIGDDMEMFGYGSDPSEIGGLLKKHLTKVVDCGSNTSDANYVFCAQNPITLACSGDSGSGIVRRDHNKRTFVSGVLSGGPSCSDLMELQQTGMVEGYYDVYARVSPHLSWICLATGICATEKATNDVIAWKSLRNPPPWFATIEKLEWEDMFL